MSFNEDNLCSDLVRKFVRELSDLLETLNPPLLDKDKIEIRLNIENSEETLNVYLPHKTIKILDITIEFDEIDPTVNIANANFHFHDYENDSQMLEDVISLISKVLQTTIEVNISYKGTKVVRINPYFVYNDREKEPLQSSFDNLTSILNPFLKLRKEIERGSFFNV